MNNQYQSFRAAGSANEYSSINALKQRLPPLAAPTYPIRHHLPGKVLSPSQSGRPHTPDSKLELGNLLYSISRSTKLATVTAALPVSLPPRSPIPVSSSHLQGLSRFS
ncbi:Hypothetical protein NTJ_09403 [Nesidiocoris tenuis]|uniref:Uncharacterized protein n=1 Tax=Nesidiocoris tenuis TaxID=355587 RepID=A0ABN7AWN2_9HEMI|nr:Hypothetical protein NTJ_09403 [Nesidiocoris tenuis]